MSQLLPVTFSSGSPYTKTPFNDSDKIGIIVGAKRVLVLENIFPQELILMLYQLEKSTLIIINIVHYLKEPFPAVWCISEIIFKTKKSVSNEFSCSVHFIILVLVASILYHRKWELAEIMKFIHFQYRWVQRALVN